MLKNLLAQIKVWAGKDPHSGVPVHLTALRTLSLGMGFALGDCWGDAGVGGAGPLGAAADKGCPTFVQSLQLPPTSSQTHPSAWPFMEPVKKSEAPDYYEIIRFPIGRLLCPAPQDRVAEEGAEDSPLIVGSVLGTRVWGGGSLGIVQSERGMS